MNESVALPAKRTALGGQMDLAQLQVFLTVARERSFSRAAEKLYRTQPAVSIAIRKLEESVGQPLFQRGARDAQLTDAGTLLCDYAERILNLRDEIQKGDRKSTRLNSSHLVISYAVFCLKKKKE